jgi:hypothetical protein
MKKIIIAAMLILLSMTASAGDTLETINDSEKIDYKFTSSRQIVFSTDKEGRLDIRLIGYTGVTDAAKDFLRYLKQQVVCPKPTAKKPDGSK